MLTNNHNLGKAGVERAAAQVDARARKGRGAAGAVRHVSRGARAVREAGVGGATESRCPPLSRFVDTPYMGQSPNYQDGLRQASVGLDPLAALRSPVDDPARHHRASARCLGVARPRDGDGSRDLATFPARIRDRRRRARMAADRSSRASMRSREDPLSRAARRDWPILGARTCRRSEVSARTKRPRSRAPSTSTPSQISGAGCPIDPRAPCWTLRAAARPSDGDEATELVPRFGEYPTERRYYSSIVMDHVVGRGDDRPHDRRTDRHFSNHCGGLWLQRTGGRSAAHLSAVVVRARRHARQSPPFGGARAR